MVGDPPSWPSRRAHGHIDLFASFGRDEYTIRHTHVGVWEGPHFRSVACHVVGLQVGIIPGLSYGVALTGARIEGQELLVSSKHGISVGVLGRMLPCTWGRLLLSSPLEIDLRTDDHPAAVALRLHAEFRYEEDT